MEDQELPKKCGHLNGKRLIPVDEMVQKIQMLKAVSPTLALVARTDARAVEGLDQAIERSQRYLEAGADVIFPEALEGEQEFRTLARSVSGPLLANMTEFGRTPYFTEQEFASFGFRLVIYPVSTLRIAAHAVQEFLATLKSRGTQKPTLEAMQTRQELYDLIGYFDYEALDQKIARTVVPITPPPDETP
jgi:methylisocitrate lyase